MSEPQHALQVRVGPVVVGWLTRSREGLTRFLPERDWLSQGCRPWLGMAFVRKPVGRSAGTGLPAWFENLLPENDSRLRNRLCRELGLRDTDSFGLLKAIGHDLPGAVVVEPDKDTRLDQAATISAADEHGMEAVHTTEDRPSGLRFSLAGVQLKFSMVQVKSRLTVPARGQDGDWIVKIPDRPLLPEVEAATMAWAAATGLDVPEHRLVQASEVTGLGHTGLEPEDTAFAIRRYDRTDGGRVHQEDMMQVLEALPCHKYAESGRYAGFSHDATGRLLLDLLGEEGALDYVRRVAFVVASGNTDAHLKNWSLLLAAGSSRPRLTPCYDQVCTLVFDQFGWEPARTPHLPELALRFGGSRALHDLGVDRVRRFTAGCGIPGGAEAFLEGLDAAWRQWPVVASQAPEIMHAALAEHWRRVPILRSFGWPHP
jgi:serine/threonine-protein kinase HipA